MCKNTTGDTMHKKNVLYTWNTLFYHTPIVGPKWNKKIRRHGRRV